VSAPRASPPHTSAPAPFAATPRAQPRQGVAGQSAALVMQEYLKGMERFLAVEQEVTETYLRRFQAVGGARAAQPAPMPAFPLLGEVTSLVPGQELTAVRHLSHD